MSPKPPKPPVIYTWLIHLYTASGLALGFLALAAAVDGRPRAAFLFMAVACIIDSTDGFLARSAQVTRWAPTFDGRRLDDITDYINYVFIPMYVMYRFELIPRGWLPVFIIPLIASAYGFCNDDAKTADGYFTGFPSYWNVVSLYQFWLRLPGPAIAATVVVLSVLVWVPIKYLYPSKTPRHRAANVGVASLWALTIVYMLVYDFDSPPQWLLLASLIYPAYYMGQAFWLHWSTRGGSPAS